MGQRQTNSASRSYTDDGAVRAEPGARTDRGRGLVRVALPAKGPGRDRWLSRSEAAALLWRAGDTAKSRLGTADLSRTKKLRRQAPASSHRTLYFDRSLYRHSRRLDCVGVTVPRERPIVRGSRKRHLLSARSGAASDQEAAAASTNSRPIAHSHAALGQNGGNRIALRRIQRCGRKIRQVGVPKRRWNRQAVHRSGQSHSTHLKAHGRNLADAAWRRSVESCRISWDVGRGVARYLRPPPSRVLARGGDRHHDETKQEHRIWG